MPFIVSFFFSLRIYTELVTTLRSAGFAVALPNQSKLPDIKLKWCWLKGDVTDVVWWRYKCSYTLLMVYQSAIAKLSKREFDWILLREQFGLVPFVCDLSSFRTVLRSYLYNTGFDSLTLYWKIKIVYV